MQTNQFALFQTRRFFPLFVTQFLGALNDNLFKNALVILITYRLANTTGVNSQILVTLAAGIFILPFFLFSAFAGQLADKYEKTKLISIIKFIEIVLMTFAAIGFYLQNIQLLMLVLFALGMHATFFGPVKYAILPEALPEDELIAGNGLIEAGTFLAILFGTILGSVLILRQQGEILISSILVVAAITGWVSSKYIKKTDNYDLSLKLNYNFFKETFAVLRYAKHRSDLFLAILGISWFWLVGAVYLAELPVFARVILHADETVVTFFLALFSIGFALGSLFCNKLLKGKVHATYVPLGVLCITIFAIDLYYAALSMPFFFNGLISINQFLHTFAGWRISVDLTLIALGGGLYTVPLYAILQQRSAKEYRARVIASNNVMNALFMVIAAGMTMIMLKLGFSIIQVFLTIAILNALVAVYICKLLPDVFIKSFFRSLLKVLYRVEISGLENYYKAGERMVIIANHTSFLDALLLAVYLPDKLSFAINKTTARKWWIRLFLRLVETYPLEPTNPMALKSLIEFVKKDRRCVIFPEGRLTMTGALMKIYEGPGLVADKSKAKLLPIRIEGAQFTPFSRLKGKVRIRVMPKIKITIFSPQDFGISSEIKGRERRQIISRKLYDVMTNIMFESSNYHETLFAALINAKTIHGSHHPIVEDVEREVLTYQQFIMRCFVLGEVFAKQTQSGEYVGILLPNMISNVLTFFALQAYNRVPAMLNYSTGANNVLTACQTAQIKTIYSSKFFVKLAKLTDMVALLKEAGFNIVYLEELRSKIGFFDKIKGFIKTKFPRFSYHLINADQIYDSNSPAVVLFTSGSEGTPKGVVLSHANIQANRYQMSACIDFTATDKIFNALPIFHSFGLTGGTLLSLLSGVKIFLYPSPLHYRVVPELVYDTNATILFGTDTFLSGYAKYAHPYDFYSMRYVFAGAEKLREETRLLWANKFGIRILEGYGATETSPVLAINTPMQHKTGTVGRFVPGIQYKLESVPGVADGGILSVSGPNIMKGYLLADSPGKLIPPVNNWYDTGDIVAVDAEGFVTIKGRVKRFAKIAGEMVSLTMIEQYIHKLWPNHQHAVINIPDPKKGEQLILVTTYLEASREALVEYAKINQLGEITVPKTIITIKKMFLLGTGKIDYTAVKEFIAKNMKLEGN